MAIVIAGHLIDRMDTRRASLLFGLCALIGTTAMFCFATTPTVLVVARALQGASSTVLEIASLALLSDTMGASTTGAAMGWQSVGRFFGVILGPSLSGVVFDLYGHFAVFGMAFLVLIFDLVLRFMMIERKVADKWILDADKNYSTIGPSQPPTSQVRHQNAAEERTGEGCDGSTATDQSKKNLACSSIPGTLDLLANPRLLMAYWATFTCSITITSLESVHIHISP
jgi:MFS family permease